MDDSIQQEPEAITKNVKLTAAPQEERPDTVYLALAGPDEDCVVVFYSHKRAVKWRDEMRASGMVAHLDAVSCADGDAKRVP